MTPSPGTGNVRSYRDLVVWQRAMQLAAESYRVARALPPTERFALRDQILRASISVPSNIAEGHGRLSRGDYVRHLGIARGSLFELETLLRLARTVGDINAGDDARALQLADEVGRMLWVLMRRLGARQFASTKAPTP